MITYSYTDISTFNRCRFLYQKTRLHGWPQADNTPKMVGDLVHVGLAAKHMGMDVVRSVNKVFDKAYSNTTDMELDEILINKSTALEIVGNASRFLEGFESYLVKGLPAVEFPVETKLSETEKFVGVVDWVAVEKSTNQVWLVDYKVRSTIEPELAEDQNLQNAIYQYLLLKAGIPVVGSICFQIRSVAMQFPKRNKDGSMSRADIVCDWPSYRSALLANSLNPADYSDMEAKLSSKRFFHATKAYRSTELLERIWQDVVLANIEDIRRLRRLSENNHHQGRPYIAARNMGSSCKLCSMVDRCQNNLRGYDTEELVVSFEGKNA